jgi:hypothetical protein
MLHGCEPVKISQHDDEPWLAATACPAAEPCADPGGVGERSFRMWGLLALGLAFEADGDPFKGLALIGMRSSA